jgi:hypothetical protein
VCVYVRITTSSYIIIYVDDALVAATTTEELDDVLNLLGERFKLKVFQPEKFLGCGI